MIEIFRLPCFHSVRSLVLILEALNAGLLTHERCGNRLSVGLSLPKMRLSSANTHVRCTRDVKLKKLQQLSTSLFPLQSQCSYSPGRMANPMSWLHILLCAWALRLSLAVTCNPPQGGTLPLLAHCEELVRALVLSGRLPGLRLNKDWGRDLPNGPRTVHLPKIYWIAEAGHKTCGITVDNDAHAPHAIENFGLEDVGLSAQRILNLCLYRKSEVGLDRLGTGRKVEVRLVRIDKDGVLQSVGGGVQSISVGNGTFLWSSKGNATSVFRN